MADLKEIEGFLAGGGFVAEGQTVQPERDRPFLPAEGLAEPRGTDKVRLGKKAKFVFENLNPATRSPVERLAPNLPKLAIDIERIPDFATSAGRGVIAGATFDLIDPPPVEDETTGMHFVRSLGGLLGATIGFGKVTETAKLAGLTSKVARGAFGAFVGTEIALTRRALNENKEASNLRDVLDTGLIAVLSAFGGPGAAAKEIENFMIKEPLGLTARYGRLGGRLRPTRVADITPVKFVKSPFRETKVIIDPEQAELVRNFNAVLRHAPRGEIRFDQLRAAAKASREGKAVGNNITIDYIDTGDLAKLVSPRLSPKELREFFGPQGFGNQLVPKVTRDLELPKIKTDLVRNEVTDEPKAVLRRLVAKGRPELGGSDPAARMRKINAELDEATGVGTQVESRATAAPVVETPPTAARTAAQAQRVQEILGGSSGADIRKTVTLPDGRIITEEQALARAGRPVRPPVRAERVRSTVEDVQKGVQKIVYKDRKNGARRGSVTYVRVAPEGSKIPQIKTGPKGLEISGIYEPAKRGDPIDFMVVESEFSPGFSEFIVKDLRARGVRLFQFDPASPRGRNLRGLTRRLGGAEIEGTNIVKFENIGSGGAPVETSGEPLILPKKGRQASLAAFRPTKFIMADLELADGLPYFKMFEAVEEARELSRESAFDLGQKAFRMIRRFKGDKRREALDYLAGTAKQRAAIRLDSDEIATLDELRIDVLNPLFRSWFGTSFDDYAVGVINPFRVVGINDSKLVKIPKEFQQIAPLVESSRVNLVERDIARFLNQHIRVGTNEVVSGPTLREANKFVNRIGVPKDSRQFLNNYLRGADGTEGMFVNRVLAPVYRGFWKTLGFDVPAEDARNVISTFNALTHAGLLGWRPAPLIRNALGGIQTSAPRIGFTWYLEGIRQSHTAEGAKIFRESGIPKEAATIIDRLDEISASKPTKLINQTSRVLLNPYARVDLYPRAHAYLGARARLLSAARRLGARAPEEQVFSATGLWQFHPVIRREVLNLWRKGKFEDAGRLFGSHAQQDSQWVYRTGFRPELLRGETGRLLGQFGVWPLNYLEYVKQIFNLPETPASQKLIWGTRWFLANAALVGAFGGVGKTVGLGPEAMQHTLGWVGLGPLFYGGGPLLEFIPAAAGLFNELAIRRKPGLATADAKRFLGTLVPGGQLLRDIERSAGEREFKKVGNSFRFVERTKEPRSNAEFLFRLGTGTQRR